MNRVRFIIVGTQRTGATLIRTTLDNHQAICCAGEVFLMRRARPYSGDFGYLRYLKGSFKHRLTHLFIRKQTVFDYLDDLYSLYEVYLTED